MLSHSAIPLTGTNPGQHSGRPRSRRRCLVAALVVCALALLTIHPALSRVRAPSSARVHEIGLGARLTANANFLDQPSDRTFTPAAQTSGRSADPVTFPYPGFAGLGGGFGLSLGYMYRGRLGCEVDATITYDQASGTYKEIEGRRSDLTLSHWALHVPVMLKGALPYPRWRPFIMAGPEIVLPWGAGATLEQDILVNPIRARADRHVLLALALGAEIRLPVRGYDVRVPVSLRGSYNPKTPPKAKDRVDGIEQGADGGELVFLAEWQWQVRVTAGVTLWFK